MEKEKVKVKVLGQEKLRLAGGIAAAACFLTLALGFGLLKGVDQQTADRMYQTGEVTDGQIVIVGIDQKALEDIGPFQSWGRDVLAMTLEALNQSEACRPAVIGVDVLFAGETDPDPDGWLAEAAGQYDNVVTASAAEFGSRLTTSPDDSFYVDSFAVLAYEEPYPALKAVTSQGHINAMLDQDGILRHQLWEYQLSDGRVIPSFSRVIVERYLAAQESEAVDPGQIRTEQAEGEQLGLKLPPTDARGFWYVPFSGKPGAYDESISVADLIAGNVPADYFAGKIVLIGPYAAGLQDGYLTSIDHAKAMYGIEYQANVIQALLRGDYKQEAGDGLQLAVVFLVTLLSGCYFFGKNRSWKCSAAVAVILVAGDLWLNLKAYQRGWILKPLWIPAGVLFIYLISVIYHAVINRLEKRRITDTFKRYVAPEIVTDILREGTDALELGGKLCEITVLFVDIRGFTTMSEALEPGQVVGILNQYLTLTSSCIMRHGGTLDKFIGDATMAFWGAPFPQEDPVMKAAQAAMDMVEGSKALARQLQKEYGRSVSFGIGIHTGQAVVGNIGAENRMDYTAIGDTVNTASRLESNAPAGTIFISRAVKDALGDRIQAHLLDPPVKLKGKKEGFEIFILDEITG